jgi:hypothetical protein
MAAAGGDRVPSGASQTCDHRTGTAGWSVGASEMARGGDWAYAAAQTSSVSTGASVIPHAHTGMVRRRAERLKTVRGGIGYGIGFAGIVVTNSA